MSFESAYNYKAYKEYRKLKQDWKVLYKGINLVDVCAVDLIDALVIGREADYYHIVCALLKRFKIEPLLAAFVSHDNVFTFDVVNRRDHLELSHAIAESVDDNAWIQLKYYYSPRRAICRFFVFLKKVIHLQTSFLNRAFIAARMAGYSCMVDDMDKKLIKQDWTNKRYIPFCASAYTEALITVYLRNKGVKTFATMHGFFGRYLNVIANDVVNGENILTDYILTFGETQRQDLIRDFQINPQRIKVAGNPKYTSLPNSIKNTFQSCLILGGIGLYDEDIRQFLPIAEHIAKEKGIQFALKPHPLSNIQTDGVWSEIKHVKLLSQSQTIKQLFESGEYDFVITHNTFSYYESMIFGLKPFRWARNENLDFDGLDDRFVTEQELIDKIQLAKETDQEMLTVQVKDILTKVLGAKINHYNIIINNA